MTTLEQHPSTPAANSHESARHFSLMNSLLAVLNSSRHDSTDAVLARYFLEHFCELGSLNVYEVAAACFTTRSGIRRFCQGIGLKNFSDLKSYTWEWLRHHDLFVGDAGTEGFRTRLTHDIRQMCTDVNELASDMVLDELATLIHTASNTVLFTSDFTSMSVRQFQQSMLYQKKLVSIVTDSTGDLAQLSELAPLDIVVVISEHGNYARAAINMLAQTRAKKILITIDAPTELTEQFSISLRLSHNRAYEQRSVYASYGVSFFLELLFNRYVTAYGA